jgi:hypothetical protein
MHHVVVVVVMTSSSSCCCRHRVVGVMCRSSRSGSVRMYQTLVYSILHGTSGRFPNVLTPRKKSES